MTNQEINVTDLQRHSVIQDARISNLETKFEMFMQSIKESNDRRDAEMQDFKQEMRQQNEMRQVEMRDRDNQRAAEIAEVRNDIKEIYKTTDAKIDSINKTITSMYNQNVIVIIGVIAIAVAVFLK